MKKIFLLTLILLLGLLVGCDREREYNALDYGVSATNTGEENSIALQALIDSLGERGGEIYIPSGVYKFAANGRQTIGSHCIKMRSGVSLRGDGESTVLMPVGETEYGLDMFYFNEYLDTGTPVYLENCSFDSFVIDGSESSCRTYTSAGKGFMFNLFRNCHWSGVTVRYTDATGFGVDCPIDSSIVGCEAVGCGKAATAEGTGASGFGIGFGYSSDENIRITDCSSCGNTKYGFFFEHQGRFDSAMYSATPSSESAFTVSNCSSSDNLSGFGGIYASSVVYRGCESGGKDSYGFYFENSTDCTVESCKSIGAEYASCVVAKDGESQGHSDTGVVIRDSDMVDSPLGALIVTAQQCAPIASVTVSACRFIGVGRAVSCEGAVLRLALENNTSDTNLVNLCGAITELTNKNNSWN